jgi:hypothetical protein
MGTAKSRFKAPLNIGQVFNSAFRMAIKYYPLLLVVGVFTFILEILFPGMDQYIYQTYLAQYGQWGKMATSAISYCVSQFMEMIGAAMAFNYVHRAERETEKDTRSFWYVPGTLVRKEFFSYVFVMIRYGVTVLLGTLLFVVPGIIWSLEYTFAGMIALLKPEGADPSRPFEESARITDGYKGDIFVISFLATFVIGIVASFEKAVAFPFAAFIHVLSMPVLVTVYIVLLRLLLDRNKISAENSGSGAQTNAGEGVTGSPA